MNRVTRRTVLAGAGAVAGAGMAGSPCESRRVQPEIRQRPAGCPPDQQARRRGVRCDPRGHQRTGRHPDLPQQPARRQHRHAEPGAVGRARHLHGGIAARQRGAGVVDQQHRLRVPRLRGRVGRGRRRPRRPHPPADRQHRPRGLRQDVGQRLPPDHQQQQARSTSRRTSRASSCGCR